MPRPVLFVLAGANGAGKSSVGGYLLARAGLSWFDPDAFARELRSGTGIDQAGANAVAWQEGMRRLENAIACRENYAFETTLGGRTVPAKIREAARSHEVVMWFCGLASPQQHIERVAARVAAGGHDIPAGKIRERFATSRENLIALMPHITHLTMYDNSADAGAGEVIPDPLLVAEMQSGKLVWPRNRRDLARTPEWAKPLLEAALGGLHGG